MKRTYTILQWRDDKIPKIIHYNHATDVNAWLEKNSVRIHKNEALAGACIHEALDGSLVMIFDRRPKAIKNRVELFTSTAIKESE